MSEYQYYEFTALDRDLTAKEMVALRMMSTRAEISATSFTNEYHWGDFKGNPELMMRKYFDAFLHYTNWGSRWLMFRLPKKLVVMRELLQFRSSPAVRFLTTPSLVVVSLRSDFEPDDDSYDSPLLSSLIPLREDILHGDYRALYLGWLVGVQEGCRSKKMVEPPVPDGLGKLPARLDSLVRFLRLYPELVSRAAETSRALEPQRRASGDWQEWIAQLSEEKKCAYLFRLVGESPAAVKLELLREFQRSHRRRNSPVAGPARRRIADLVSVFDR